MSDDGTHPAGSFSYYTNTALAAIAIGDMESDGDKMEVVAVSGELFPATRVRVLIWNPKAPSVAPWGQFHQNEKRTGIAPGTPGCSNVSPALQFHSVTPCRVIDTRSGRMARSVARSCRRTDRESSDPSRELARSRPGAVALAVNVTVTATAATGSLRVYSGNLAPTLFNSVSFAAGAHTRLQLDAPARDERCGNDRNSERLCRGHPCNRRRERVLPVSFLPGA